MRKNRSITAVIAMFAIVGLAVGSWAQDSRPQGRPQHSHHGAGHAENHDWYRGLTQPGTGSSCCNGTKDGVEGDCRPTRAYLGDDGQWRALLDGRWIPVPPRAVLDSRLNKDAIRSHICAGRSGVIYCFIGAGDGV